MTAILGLLDDACIAWLMYLLFSSISMTKIVTYVHMSMFAAAAVIRTYVAVLGIDELDEL